MSSARSVRGSTFRAVSGPDLAPRHWLAWFFSVHGAGAWPIVEGSAEDDPNIRIPKLPPTVAVVPEQPRPDVGRQVVVAADDETWELVVWTFPDPEQPPTSEVRWPFPRLD